MVELTIAPEFRDHVAIPLDRLAHLLGMGGEPHRSWVENEGDYLHLITKAPQAFPNSVAVARGGYIDNRSAGHDRDTWRGEGLVTHSARMIALEMLRTASQEPGVAVAEITVGSAAVLYVVADSPDMIDVIRQAVRSAE